jgi:hypothetical protein
MSTSFRDMEGEAKANFDIIERDMTALKATLPSSPSGAIVNRSEINRRIAKTLNAVKDAMSIMTLEVNELPAEERAAAKIRLQDHKSRLQSLAVAATDLQRKSDAADRTDLLARTAAAKASGGAISEGDSAVATAVATTDLHRKGVGTLKEAERLTHRMNETGDAILQELGRQDDTINSVVNIVHDTDKDLSSAQLTLRQMEKLMQKNKFMLVGVIFILTMIIVGILYYMFGGTDTGGTTTAAPGTGGSVIASPSSPIGSYSSVSLPPSAIPDLP